MRNLLILIVLAFIVFINFDILKKKKQFYARVPIITYMYILIFITSSVNASHVD